MKRTIALGLLCLTLLLGAAQPTHAADTGRLRIVDAVSAATDLDVRLNGQTVAAGSAFFSLSFSLGATPARSLAKVPS